VACFIAALPVMHVFDTVSETLLYCQAYEVLRQEEEEDVPTIGFECVKISCLECCCSVRLNVERSAKTGDVPCSVFFNVAFGAASEGLRRHFEGLRWRRREGVHLRK